MGKVIKFVSLLCNPNMLLAAIWARVGSSVPDNIYLKVRYCLIMGRRLNLDNPKTFNEKLNWLKIFNRQPVYAEYTDKYTVKSYIEGLIGQEKIIPTLGVWDNFDEIDFDSLPKQFVLKSTNGGGGTGVIICKDKLKLNKEDAKSKLETSMKSNWKIQREWVYMDIKPRIIAETYLENDSDELRDYKFFCFNGRMKLFKVDFDRFINHHANYYDRDCNILPFGEKICPPNYNKKIVLPDNIEEMIEIAERLSAKIPFIRVDLYEVNGKIYFGEMTFFPDSGISKFSDEEWDYRLGSWIKLPQSKKTDKTGK